MLSVKRSLRQLALKTIVPQLSKPIGVDTVDEYTAVMERRKIVVRAIQRSLIYAVSGQTSTKLQSLKECGKRGLWLYFGEGQLGDALMDLAPRTLLHENGYRIDLLTDKTLAAVFDSDPWFEKVSDDPQVFVPQAYDFAIVLSNKRRSIQCKRQHFKNLPWVSIHESFAGPSFDRAGFSTQRLADLLGLNLSPQEFSHHANQKLKTYPIKHESKNKALAASEAVALCVGGVDPLRTYAFWPQVVSELLNHGLKAFVLVGSSNGELTAALIEREFKSSASIHNWVGTCDISKSRELIASSRVVVSTDGGLLHLAATTATPIVGLFCSNIKPQWRLQAHTASTYLCSATLDVNDISPALVSQKIREFLVELNRHEQA